MNIRIDIKYEQLKKIITQLPSNELKEIKEIVDDLTSKEELKKSKNNLQEILLNGPTLNSEQISKIKEARKSISKWRAK